MAERPITPSQQDVIRAWIEHYAQDMHTAMPGRVHAINWDAGTVDVEPLVRHAVLQSDGSREYEDLPILPAVPLVTPRTEQWFVSLPIAPGDTVLVVFCESAHGAWWAGDGSLQYPGDLRRHDLSHAVAIPGMFVKQKALASDQGAAGNLANDLVLGKDGGTRIAVKSSGEVSMAQGGSTVFHIDGSGNVHLATSTGTALAMANRVDEQINTLRDAINGWNPVPNDGGAALKTALLLWLASTSAVGATKVNGT
jgi:hypothetical protein